MLLVREITHCKPGKVRPMVEKLLAMSKLHEQHGMPRFRVLTDFSAGRCWTIVAAMEIESLQAFEAMMRGQGVNEAVGREAERLMHGYHDPVEEGRPEIWTIER
jgi:hypothetical protein